MSTNKENEETFRQMTSRLQKLEQEREAQRRWKKYKWEEKERTEREVRAYAWIWIALAFTITLLLSIIFSAPPPTPFILGIIALFCWILGLSMFKDKYWLLGVISGLVILVLFIKNTAANGTVDWPYHLSALDTGRQNIGMTLPLSQWNAPTTMDESSGNNEPALKVTVAWLQFGSDTTIPTTSINFFVQGADTYDCSCSFFLWRSPNGPLGGLPEPVLPVSASPPLASSNHLEPLLPVLPSLVSGNNKVTFPFRPQEGEEWNLFMSISDQSQGGEYAPQNLYLQF